LRVELRRAELRVLAGRDERAIERRHARVAGDHRGHEPAERGDDRRHSEAGRGERHLQ
jgi:hypothetical protein